MALSESSTSTSLRLVLTRWHIAATNRSMRTERIFVKIFVAATEFCLCNKSHKFSPIWFFATRCSDKILLWRQIFSKKFPVHRKRFVAATCRLTLLLKLVTWHVHLEWSVTTPSVYRPLLKCYSFSQQSFHQTKSGRNKTSQKSCKSEVILNPLSSKCDKYQFFS